jgi:dolichol kinase/uncharacterized protein YukE
MTASLALQSHELALDLRSLLHDLDPARWTAELVQDFQDRLTQLQQRLEQLLAASFSENALVSLRDRLRDLEQLLAAYAPPTQGDLEQAWQDFRTQLQPAYEALAIELGSFDIHLPSLRPTNYSRNVLHMFGGLTAVVLIESIPSVSVLQAIAGTWLATAWTLELSRRFFPSWNALLMRILGKVAHPHESHRVNSATWFCTALFVLSLTGSHLVCAIGAVVLALADPAAALVGRRFGKTKLVNGRSLQGTLAFFLVGLAAAWTVLAVAHPAVSLLQGLLVASLAAAPAALAELFSRRIDDNLSIPLSAAAGAWAAMTWLVVL